MNSYFPKVLYDNKHIKIFKHTKESNWTVDFRWDLFDQLRGHFWIDSISEVIYNNNRIYDKFHSQEFAGVVLDGLSKWSQHYEFKRNGSKFCFYNPKYNYYSNPIEDIEDPKLFYNEI